MIQQRALLVIGCIAAAVFPRGTSSQISVSDVAVRSVYGRVVKGGTTIPVPSVRAAVRLDTIGSVGNDSGVFVITGVPTGEQSIVVQHPCYFPVQIAIPAEGDVELSVGLPYDAASVRRAGCGGLQKQE